MESNRGAAPDLNRNDPAESNRRGVAFVEQGKLIEAEGIFRSALADCENCAALTSILNNLGEVYYATGRWQLPARFTKERLALREKQEGPDALLLLPLLNNLALLYRETADYSRALALPSVRVSIAELHNAAEARPPTAQLYSPISARSSKCRGIWLAPESHWAARSRSARVCSRRPIRGSRKR